MKTIYYYYYLFYSKKLNEDSPHRTTLLSLSASEGFLISGMIQLFFARFYCISIGKWVMLSICVLMILLNYLYFDKSGLAKEIIKIKPLLLKSPKISVVMTILFFIISVSIIFWGPICVKELLSNCNS